MEGRIEVEGLNVLVRNLRRVNSEYGRAVKGIHTEIAQPIAARARTKARKKTGRMVGSIRPYATQRAAHVGAGARVIYAGVQHYGWPGHNISPNPFLTEAVNEGQAQTVRDYETLLMSFIDKVWVDNYA